MENERETQQIMMNVSRAGKVIKTMLLIGNPATMLLLTYLKRMVKQKLLKVGEYDKIESFINATKGNYNIMNVPINQSGAIKGYWDKKNISNELEAMGISFSILPDLNRNDGIMQIAIADKDKGKFSAWFSRHIVTQMQGGEKGVQDLQNLTDGQVSVISIPFEQREHLLREDFERLGINYAILPDLNVGDNNIQLYVANNDLQKVEHWFSLYKEDCIGRGEDAPEMQVLNTEKYMDTGKIDEEQYMNTADEKIKAANETFEGKAPGDLETEAAYVQIRSTEDSAYDVLHNDPDYKEITINKQSLVDNSAVASKTPDSDYFASRIPGTWGENELTLVLPKEQVFKTDHGQTYIAFIPKKHKPLVLDANAKPKSVADRLTGAELGETYDKVKRKFTDKKQLKDNAQVLESAKEAGKTILTDHAPTNPIKVK